MRELLFTLSNLFKTDRAHKKTYYVMNSFPFVQINK